MSYFWLRINFNTRHKFDILCPCKVKTESHITCGDCVLPRNMIYFIAVVRQAGVQCFWLLQIFFFFFFFFLNTLIINMFSYVSTSTAYHRMRTSRAWEVHIPSSASSILPPPSVHPLLPPYPQGSRERARVRNCVGMAVCVIEGVGPLGVSGELHEFVMSAMLAMAYWTGEEQRRLRKKRPTESDRDPGLPGSDRAATDPSLPSIDRLTPRDRHRFIHENSRQTCCYS